MAEVTVKQFADVVGIPIERLLAQLGNAGLSPKTADDHINDKEKLQLLAHLRHLHGKETEIQTDSSAPKKIILKRKTLSEIKVPSSQGKAKTVPVEVRKKRTYVKRGAVTDQDNQRLNKERERPESAPPEIAEEIPHQPAAAELAAAALIAPALDKTEQLQAELPAHQEPEPPVDIQVTQRPQPTDVQLETFPEPPPPPPNAVIEAVVEDTQINESPVTLSPDLPAKSVSSPPVTAVATSNKAATSFTKTRTHDTSLKSAEANHKRQATDSKPHSSDSKRQSNYKRPSADFKRPSADFKRPSADVKPPVADLKNQSTDSKRKYPHSRSIENEKDTKPNFSDNQSAKTGGKAVKKTTPRNTKLAKESKKRQDKPTNKESGGKSRKHERPETYHEEDSLIKKTKKNSFMPSERLP